MPNSILNLLVVALVCGSCWPWRWQYVLKCIIEQVSECRHCTQIQVRDLNNLIEYEFEKIGNILVCVDIKIEVSLTLALFRNRLV